MAQESRLRETLDAFVAQVREALDARAQDLTADLTRAIQEADATDRSERDRAMATERQHLEAQLADERAALARQHAEFEAGIAARFEDERRGIEDHLARAPLERLLDAVRRLDSASSLSGILESLAQCTLVHASRVAVFVVSGETLKSWGHFGFEAGQGAFDVPIDAVKVVTSAMSTQQSAVFRAADGEDPSLPPFMRPPHGHLGLVAPLVVGGHVVVVLYADGADATATDGDRTERRVAWADEVELITRHARARLENVTSERTVTALTRSL